MRKYFSESPVLYYYAFLANNFEIFYVYLQIL